MFRKRSFSEMGNVQREALKKINLDAPVYDSFLDHSASSSSIDDSVNLLSSPVRASACRL